MGQAERRFPENVEYQVGHDLQQLTAIAWDDPKQKRQQLEYCLWSGLVPVDFSWVEQRAYILQERKVDQYVDQLVAFTHEPQYEKRLSIVASMGSNRTLLVNMMNRKTHQFEMSQPLMILPKKLYHAPKWLSYLRYRQVISHEEVSRLLPYIYLGTRTTGILDVNSGELISMDSLQRNLRVDPPPIAARSSVLFHQFRSEAGIPSAPNGAEQRSLIRDFPGMLMETAWVGQDKYTYLTYCFDLEQVPQEYAGGMKRALAVLKTIQEKAALGQDRIEGDVIPTELSRNNHRVLATVFKFGTVPNEEQAKAMSDAQFNLYNALTALMSCDEGEVEGILAEIRDYALQFSQTRTEVNKPENFGN